jgi:hypothetical protein
MSSASSNGVSGSGSSGGASIVGLVSSIVSPTPTTSTLSTPSTGITGARKKMILDCDTGVDDAWAIALAMLSPDVELLAITTVTGNVHVNHVVKNTLRVLAMIKQQFPVVSLPMVGTAVAPSYPPGSMGHDYS